MEMIYRADTIGSMVRPAYLNEARAALRRGDFKVEEFTKLEDRAVHEAIALQEQAGLDVVTDGEMRRTIFVAPGSGSSRPPANAKQARLKWRRQVGGVLQEQETISWVSAFTSRLQFTHSAAADEFAYAQAITKKPVKVAIPAPTAWLNRWTQDSAEVYPTPFELMMDAAEVTRQDIQALKAAGCRYIQLDAPELCGLGPDQWEMQRNHPKTVQWMGNEGLDVINSLATVPGITFGLHICRGNHKGFWMGEAPWEALAKRIIPRTPNFDIFLLEYDDWRSGSFEPLKEVPHDKIAVLGLISTKREELEPADQIIKRIDEASRFFPRQQLALSTQCGFAPAADGSVVSLAGEETKLRLVVDIARRVWS